MSVLILLPIQMVYAPPPEPSPEDDFRYSDHVITGKIISSEIIIDPREDNSAATFYDTIIYKVKVVEWHKNPLENNIITVYGTHHPNDVVPEPEWGVVEFEIGDTVYWYIDQTDDGLHFREYGSRLVQEYVPEVELLPSTLIKYGDIFTIHAWLPTYEEKSDLLRYYVDVRDSKGNQVDSTLWFARQDFVYEFDTTHTAYNITRGKYFIKIEKADGVNRTGIYSKTLEFEITKQTCRSDLFLAFRADDSRTACVKPFTLDKLIERAWAKPHTDIGSLDVKINKDGKIVHCPKDSRLIQGGYYLTDDSTLSVSQKRFDVKGWMVEFRNPEEYKQYAYVFVDCVTGSPEIWAEPLNKMTLWADPFFSDPDKFAEINEKKDTRCFTTPSMNYFCYAKPRMYEEGIGVSWLISNTTKISGELHFDNVNVGPSYFTIKNMTQIDGDTAMITFADRDGYVYEQTSKRAAIFEFSRIVEKFDTFVAKCENMEGTSVTIVQYLGIITIDSVDYFMTWHLNANSEAGIACDYPQIIQNSFDNDFGNIGHEWRE